MAVEGGNNVEQSVELLKQIETMVQEAKKSLFRGDLCTVDRAALTGAVQKLRQGFPEAVEKAAEIVAADTEIRAKAAQDAEETVSAAKAEAERIAEQSRKDYEAAQASIREEEAKAEQIRKDGEELRQNLTQQAQSEANAIVEDGKRQAQKIVADAEAEARRMTEQESIYRRAQIAAQEMTENANNQINQARQKTYAFLDEMLGRAEGYVGSLVQEVHQERENLNGMR